MNVNDYFRKILHSCEEVFEESIKNHAVYGEVHDLSANIFEFANVISDSDEASLIRVIPSQLELAAMTALLGLYRQSFASLRLTLEMCLGAIHFSANKLEYLEWVNGAGDIKWARLIDDEDGVLSKRFARAFFPDLEQYMDGIRGDTKQLYRDLSEFVHGNFHTWENGEVVIRRNASYEMAFSERLKELRGIILFSLACRYLTKISRPNLEMAEHVFSELAYFEPVRRALGGPCED